MDEKLLMFANKISNLRRSKRPKMTQEKLAEKVGVETTTVWRWENGRSMPDTKHIPLLADILGCSERFLLDLEDESLINETKKEDLFSSIVRMLATFDYDELNQVFSAVDPLYRSRTRSLGRLKPAK